MINLILNKKHCEKDIFYVRLNKFIIIKLHRIVFYTPEMPIVRAMSHAEMINKANNIYTI